MRHTTLRDITRDIESFNGDVDRVALLHLINGKKTSRLVAKTKLPDSLVESYNDHPNGNVAPLVRAFALLRWPEDGETMKMFRYISDLACKCIDRKPQYYQRLIRNFYTLCAILQPSGMLTPRLLCTTREDIIDAVRHGATQDLKRYLPPVLYQFRSGVWVNVIPSWTNWRTVTHRDLGYIAVKRQRSRSAFTFAEVNILFEASKQESTRSHAMLRFYVHTGCRNSAACELLVKNVWNADTKQCLPEGVVMEKFGIRHRFEIDSIFAEALRAHIMESGVTTFVFPNKSGKKERHQHTLRWFKALCASVHITGDHVFLHALRRTAITVLVESGNKIEDVSLFAGHKSVEMTRHYVERNVATVTSRMHVPWLSPPVAGTRLVGHSTDPRMSNNNNFPVLQFNGEHTSTASSKSGGTDVSLEIQRRTLGVIESQRNEIQALKRESNWIVENLLTDVLRERLLEYQLSPDAHQHVDATLPPDQDCTEPVDDDQTSILQSIARNYRNLAAAVPSHDSESDEDVDCSDGDDEA